MTPLTALLVRIAMLGFTAFSAASTSALAATEATLPASVNISYRMSSSLADGIATFAWKREGSGYQLESSIEASGLFALVSALRQSSRGEVTAQGLQPAFFSIKRGDGMADTASFNRDSNELKVFARGENKVMPLLPQLQDTLSFLFQLPYDLRALKKRNDRLNVVVSNARKVYRHEFVQVGEETLETKMGALKTVHLKSEATNPEDVYEVWLALDNFYLPVKIKFFAGRFLIEQTVTGIRIDGR